MALPNLQQLDDFLTNPVRNEWVHCGSFALYVRKGYHKIEGKIERCFDLASIENKESQRGKGRFKALLPVLMERAKSHGLSVFFVENLLNDRLAAYLRTVGFKDAGAAAPLSLYRRL